jgi:hypothetical protein
MRKLREGPDIASYRGLKIINTRAFSLEEGAPPRDVLRRRVRVAEYHRIPYTPGVEHQSFAFYDESKDAWQKFSWNDLFRMSHIGEINERDGSADWDDEDAAFDQRVTKLPNYGITDVAMDVFIQRTVFEHMTVGGFTGDTMRGFTLENEGNLVLNPWYAMHGIEITGNGLQVPVPDAAAAFDANTIRQPHPLGGAPPIYPVAGERFGVAGHSEHSFSGFPEYLQAFGYKGNMNFTSKTPAKRAALIAALRSPLPVAGGGGPIGLPGNAPDFVAGTGLALGLDVAEAYVDGRAALTAAHLIGYTAILNRPEFNEGCLRGQPDYEHRSYTDARHNFYNYLMLYISGRSDRLPSKAKEFFDNFNWQRLGLAVGVNRVNVFATLIARAFHVDRPAVGPYPGAGRPGIPTGAATLADRVAALVPLLRDTEMDRYELVVVRPNIEHNMLGIIMGRGGLDELGATFWGQTELSCYDDSMHGEFRSCTVFCYDALR